MLMAWGQGDESALARLMPLVHDELHRLARREMRGERDGHTLQTTALVNEAYLRLIDLSRVRWQDRAHFFAMSARLMRRILVDHARSRNFIKRGGGTRHVSLDEALIVSHGARRGSGRARRRAPGAGGGGRAQEPGGRDAVLRRPERRGDRRGAAVSPETVMRDWRLAKVWLLRELRRRWLTAPRAAGPRSSGSTTRRSSRTRATRAAFLAEACAATRPCAHEVESLLEFDTAAGDVPDARPALEARRARAADARRPRVRAGRSTATRSARSRRRRHGRGLSRAGPAARPRRRAQSAAAGSVATDPGYLADSRTEARSASVLNHPNIVTIYGVGEDAELSYIAMERVHGRTLREIVGRGRPRGAGRPRSRRAARRRARRRARQRHRPPRSEARQRDGHARGPAQGARLRHREAQAHAIRPRSVGPRRPPRGDPGRHDPRHRRLHVARAGRGRRAAPRRTSFRSAPFSTSC